MPLLEQRSKVCTLISMQNGGGLMTAQELQVLREMLMHKYGREFSIGVMDNKDSCVSERVSSCCNRNKVPNSDSFVGFSFRLSRR